MNHKLLARQLKLLNLDEHRLPTDLQAWRSFISKVNAVYTDNDQDRYLLERSLDISSKEMQKRWKELKLLEEQWRSLGECTPDFIAMIDVDKTVLFANKSKGKINKDSLAGLNILDFYSCENKSLIQKTLDHSIRDLKKTVIEFQVTAGSGDTWYSLRVSPIVRGDELVGLTIIETDITDMRNFAFEHEARKKAEEAVETKARFLANVSHEIRTPLNGILGMANLLVDHVADNDSAHKVRIIQNCGETLLALINDILDFSKLEAGKVVLEDKPFELSSSVQDIVDLLAPKASEKGLLLQYKIEDSVPNWVFGDTTRLRQVLLNLIGNAIKFTAQGEVLVSVTSHPIENKVHEIRFAVIDTGIGIDSEGQKKLFRSFSQIDAGIARKFGGTGLGLSISKGLVEAMGGEIGVNSSAGKGSEFYFSVVFKEAKAHTLIKRDLGSDLGQDMGKLFPLKILLAEDSRVNQLVAIGYLKKFGYVTDVAGNGLEVIEALKRKNYDIILMDCHMPEMDGFETTREIYKRWPDRRPKIIAATASTMEEDRRMCEKVGMDDMLPKPITLSGLVGILRKYAIGGVDQDENGRDEPLDGLRNLHKEELLYNFKGVEDILFASIPTYLECLPEFVSAIEAAVNKADFQVIANVAHTLKGSSTNFYAEKVIRICEKLQKFAVQKDVKSITKYFAELKSQVAILTHELNLVAQELKKAA